MKTHTPPLVPELHAGENIMYVSIGYLASFRSRLCCFSSRRYSTERGVILEIDTRIRGGGGAKFGDRMEGPKKRVSLPLSSPPSCSVMPSLHQHLCACAFPGLYQQVTSALSVWPAVTWLNIALGSDDCGSFHPSPERGSGKGESSRSREAEIDSALLFPYDIIREDPSGRGSRAL